MRILFQVADSCLQFWGGMGFTNDVLVSRYYRYTLVSLYWLEILVWLATGLAEMNEYSRSFVVAIMNNDHAFRDMRLTSIGGGADEVTGEGNCGETSQERISTFDPKAEDLSEKEKVN